MRQMEAVVMEILWSLHFLALLLSAHSVHSHNNLPGLSCVNDFVNNISCTWNSSQADPGVDCWVLGTKSFFKYPDTIHIKRNCKLKMQDSLGDSVQSCSFVFENSYERTYGFSYYEKMPSIEVQCNNLTVDGLTDYMPVKHIKMHPPGSPNISSGVNETWIGWDPGDQHSDYFSRFQFEIQIKQHHQTWEEVKPLPTQEQVLKIPVEGRQAGLNQVRVRVKPEPIGDDMNSYWSNWSPTASWETPAQEQQVLSADLMSWLLFAGLSVFIVFTVILIVLCKARSNPGLCKGMPVPDPSKYFHTVHRGNFKEWLNPQTALECYFTVQSCDRISSVEVFDPVSTPCFSSTSATAMLHPRHLGDSSGLCISGLCISGGGGGGVNVSSSFFSNVVHNKDYFFSVYPSGPPPSSDPCPVYPSGPPPSSDPCPVYFTYQDDFLTPHNAVHTLHLTHCSSPAPSLSYEVLRRPGSRRDGAPQSPDSGFSTEDQADEEEEEAYDEDGAEFSDDPQESGLLILPLHLRSPRGALSSLSRPPSSSSPPPSPISSPIPPDPPKLETPLVVGGGSYVAWPAGSAAGSCGSVPVEHGNGGYLTLKDLHNTYRNKSI